jgi:Exonuclease VII, large subunit
MSERNNNMNKSWITPSDIVEKLSMLISGGFVLPVKVRGTVILDRGYYRLTDGEAAITLLNVGNLLEPLVNAEVEIDGVLAANTSRTRENTVIYPGLRVNSFKVLNEEEDREFQEEMEFQRMLAEVKARLRNRNQYIFWQTFSRLLKEEKHLRVGLIYGNSAQVPQDFIIGYEGAAGEYRDRIKFVKFESSLSDEQLARTIEEVANSEVHAVFLLRGGDSPERLARVGGFESAMTIIRVNIPFYVAIGHSLDRMVSLLEKVADGIFATPTKAGEELGTLVYLLSDLENLEDKARNTEIELRLKEQELEQKRKELLDLGEQLKRKEQQLKEYLTLKEELLSLKEQLNLKEQQLQEYFTLKEQLKQQPPEPPKAIPTWVWVLLGALGLIILLLLLLK